MSCRIIEPSELFGRLIGLCQQFLRHLDAVRVCVCSRYDMTQEDCRKQWATDHMGANASVQLASAMLASHTFANIWNVAVGRSCRMASCHYNL